MKSIDLALWYLRLNGFLSVSNFVLHPKRRGSQETDADIVAVRFPYKAEFDNDPADDHRFTKRAGKPYFIVAESTTGVCKLNEPWTKADAFCYVLRAFGPIPTDRVPFIADHMARAGVYSDESIDCGLLCLGISENPDLRRRYPSVEQVRWQEVTHFFHRRFSTYDRRKRDHEQWDLVGNNLWDFWNQFQKKEEKFWLKVCQECGLANR